ncbi:MAG: hypothetical protein MK160_10700 [Rhodobacteraceae bacterium]|nr:hypothetical protein [Paracoccaceae bacterium]
MFITAFAILVMFGSACLIIVNLRAIMQDTVEAILNATAGGRASDRAVPSAAFAMLWMLIFILCYL